MQQKFKVLGNGNLNFELVNGQTVGEMVCEALAEKNVLNIQKKTVIIWLNLL